MTRPPGTDKQKQSNPNLIGDRPGVQGRCGAGSGPSIRGSALPCLLPVARGEKSPKAISVSAAAAAAAPVVSAAAPGHGDLVVSAAELPAALSPRPVIRLRCPSELAPASCRPAPSSLSAAPASSLRRARLGKELAPASSPRQNRPSELAPASSPWQARHSKIAPASSPWKARPGELALASAPIMRR